MFADRAKIFIRSGKGGDGHVSFRRELYVPDGGPDGGDGGDGGDVIFVVDPGLNTLTDFRHVRKYVAQDGEEGGKRNCHGANGNDIILKVPAGTVVKDAGTGSHAGAESDRRCGTGRIPECWKIHSVIPCDQRTAEDCQLPFYNFKSEPGCSRPGWRWIRDRRYSGTDRGRF